MTEQEPDKILYTIQKSAELGRYLVASQDIEPRTLIICEDPLVCGPADDETYPDEEKIPKCLGCCRCMTARPWNRCSKCSWPVCGVECEKAEHHAENECQVFVRNSVNYPCRHTWPIVNKSILVLRTLLQKSKSPSVWHEVVLNLEHHTQIRQTKLYCSNADIKILDNLKDFLHGCGTVEEITRISGIINVNAFSSSKSDFQGTNVRIVQCIYSQASLLAHSCIPNATWSIDASNKFRISIRSTVRIRKGEMINIAYNIPEMAFGTLHRIIAIEDVAHFICKCRRCSDPTEADTFVSGIKCFHCNVNYLLPDYPTNPDSRWKCRGCESSQTVQKIVLFLSQIEEMYEAIKKSYSSGHTLIQKLDMFIRQYEGQLHKNHYILQEIRMKIINLQFQTLDDISEMDLESYIHHCKTMLSISDKLMPGFSKARALMQFFLSQGLFRLAANKHTDPDGKEALQNLYKDIYCLQTRSLLYFNCQHSSNVNLTSEANQFVTHIRRQLKTFAEYINT